MRDREMKVESEEWEMKMGVVIVYAEPSYQRNKFPPPPPNPILDASRRFGSVQPPTTTRELFVFPQK